MEISKLTTEDVKHYLRIVESDEHDDALIASILNGAKSYVSGQTGLSMDEMDKYSDLTIAILIICQDMYDNRSMYVDKNNLNKTVESIISMHSSHLVE